MAPRVGLEPTTLGLEVLCSIQLSYQGKTVRGQFCRLERSVISEACADLQMYDGGAGGENRTPISSLEGWHISRYTTPAMQLL